MTCRAMAKTQMGPEKVGEKKERGRERKRGSERERIKLTREIDEIHHVSGATSRIVPLCMWCNYKHCWPASTTAYYTVYILPF